jgi:hypothetical protein
LVGQKAAVKVDSMAVAKVVVKVVSTATEKAALLAAKTAGW